MKTLTSEEIKHILDELVALMTVICGDLDDFSIEKATNLCIRIVYPLAGEKGVRYVGKKLIESVEGVKENEILSE